MATQLQHLERKQTVALINNQYLRGDRLVFRCEWTANLLVLSKSLPVHLEIDATSVPGLIDKPQRLLDGGRLVQ